LKRLLAGAPCKAQVVDTRTVRIVAATPPAAAAPSHEPPRPPTLVDELVVTATKRPAALERLPAGVSALSREQITTTGAVDPTLTIGQLAGVLTTNLGPGRDKLLIRGLSDGSFTGRARSTVSTYLDDAPINYNAPDPDLRLVDIERIEVIRGPQGALYGSGAIAGIYRIVTRKPDPDEMEAGATAGVATTKGGDPSKEIEGYLNLPLADGRAALRVAAYEDLQGGYLDNVNPRATNVDGTRRNGGRAALRVKLSDNWRLDLIAANQHLRTDDTSYVIVPLPSPAPEAGETQMSPGVRPNNVREVHNNDFAHVAGTLDGGLGWANLTSSLAYVHHTYSSQYDARGADIDRLTGEPASQGAYLESARIDMLVEDLVLRSARAGPLTWLVGAYAARTTEKTPSTLTVLGSPAASTIYREARKDRLSELAVYGEGSYEFASGWTATLGGRLFRSRVHTSANVMIDAPAATVAFDARRTSEGRRDVTGFLPKLSIQREFDGGDLVYALFSEGYRPGGFNTSGYLQIRDARTAFAPDRLRNYEVGTKLRGLGGRLAVRAAAYYDEWDNIQTDQYRPSGLSYTANAGDAHIYGLEGEVGYEWPFGLTLQLNGNLTDSKVINGNPDFPNPLFGSKISDSLPGVPKVSGGVLAIYQRPLSDALTLRVIGQASYVGRASLSFDAGVPARMGHYLRARLAAELATDRWRAQLYVSNPFDDAGDTFAYGNPFTFSSQGVQQSTPQRPRTIGLRVGAAF
jgi:outer membrane receptor protein involved in Fe transport